MNNSQTALHSIALLCFLASSAYMFVTTWNPVYFAVGAYIEVQVYRTVNNV